MGLDSSVKKQLRDHTKAFVYRNTLDDVYKLGFQSVIIGRSLCTPGDFLDSFLTPFVQIWTSSSSESRLRAPQVYSGHDTSTMPESRKSLGNLSFFYSTRHLVFPKSRVSPSTQCILALLYLTRWHLRHVPFKPLEHQKKAGVYSSTKDNNIFGRTRAAGVEPSHRKQASPSKSMGISGT